MNKIVLILIVLFCFGLIVLGIFNKQSKTQTNQVVSNTMVSSTDLSTTTATSPVTGNSVIQSMMVKYYPENATTVAGMNSVLDPEADYIITPAQQAQIYLVDKYKPGICFGKPLAPTQDLITKELTIDSILTRFIKSRYQLTTDLDIYNKLKQLRGVSLTETKSGTFDYIFKDGRCTDVVDYRGVVEVFNGRVSDNLVKK